MTNTLSDDIPALIELYMELFDVDWLLAEEIVHSEAERGDNDEYWIERRCGLR